MLVDLDHLLASPIFEANRCSINFHPLHSYYAIVVYVVLLFLKRPFRLIGIGLLMHMCTDLIDCVFSFHACRDCLAGAPAEDLVKLIYGYLP